ncbi:Reverse transcriptase-related protein [Klebsormidium nitens]|uniref:Reverse transcriptase-related protein n=1 Tax=Klebsormidium nitens TaxID=105231 RepID=A0A1Y1IF39_KLENI|nr:Reverse transcriptase-related protein [Klebsormidium nitens]|eukprot:GAQ86738.1 Reverse transcriptase-related protein [Klebsormidium nitens]
MWLKFSGLGPAGRDLFLCLVYLPPEQSSWYRQAGISVEEVFEQLRDEVGEALLCGEVLLAGDFNARTGVVPDWMDCRDLHLLAQTPDAECFSENCFFWPKAQKAFDPSQAAADLEEAIESAALEAFPTPQSRKDFVGSGSPAWFDTDCRTARRRFRDALKAGGPSHLSSQLKKEYRKLVRRKKRAFSKYRAAKLEDQILNSPGRFWKQFRKKRQGLGLAHKEGLVRHCQNLYEQSEVEEDVLADATHASHGFEEVIQARGRSEGLEGRILESEVEAALKGLKNGKSADLKGFTAELLKAGQKQLVAGLTQVFNRAFEEGVFPSSWNEGVLVAIFKKGDPSDYGNYRTVTVGPILGKLFATVINRRLTEWAEKGSIRANGQAGFRKGFRAADHLLALRVLIERWGRGRDRHLFACFVDFKKAFDLVPRQKLWRRLKELGVGEEMLQSVQSMYTDVRCRVRGEGWISEESFKSSWGVKQGCPLSPLLFGLYIDGLEESMRGEEDPTLKGVRFPLLAFADDVLLLSRNPEGDLQRKLRLLEKFSKESGLSVNLQKTQIVVFGGRFSSQKGKHDFEYGEELVEIVQSYRYLGVQFNCNGKFTEAVQHLVEAGRKASFAMERRCAELGLRRASTRVGLFDVLVSPILGNGAEVWGPGYGPEWGWNGDGDGPEKVHRAFLRGLLKVRKSSLSKAVLGEFGRFPLVIRRWAQVFKFVNRTASLAENRLARLAFEESKEMWAANEGGWYARIVGKACELVSADESIGVLNLALLQERSEMAYMQDLREGYGRKFCTYFEDVKEGYSFESFIDEIGVSKYFDTLAKFRVGAHKLAIETGSWQGIAREERLCQVCTLGAVESERHFVYNCPAYSDI